MDRKYLIGGVIILILFIIYSSTFYNESFLIDSMEPYWKFYNNTQPMQEPLSLSPLNPLGSIEQPNTFQNYQLEGFRNEIGDNCYTQCPYPDSDCCVKGKGNVFF